MEEGREAPSSILVAITEAQGEEPFTISRKSSIPPPSLLLAPPKGTSLGRRRSFGGGDGGASPRGGRRGSVLVEDGHILPGNLAVPSPGLLRRRSLTPDGRRGSLIPQGEGRRGSLVPPVEVRRGSQGDGRATQEGRRGSVLEALSATAGSQDRKLKELVTKMKQPSREVQKSFTWDTNTAENPCKEGKVVQALIGPNRVPGFKRPPMSHDAALNLLGLTKNEHKTKDGVSRKLDDYTEQEVTKAFQDETLTQGKLI